MSLPVLPMRPLFLDKIWGGARIGALPAKAHPQDAPPSGCIGESWEVADLPEGASIVCAGPFAGVSLRDMMAQHGHALGGPRTLRDAGGTLRFPLLVKIIDAADDLSVQVHPDEAYAARHPGAYPKDEAWLVLDAADDARLLHGLLPEVDRVAFERAIQDGVADRMLREVRARAGDVLHIPPGTLHAVGRGYLLLEVQQPSDTTFRVFDFNRTGADGKPRALHVQQALEVATFGAQPEPLVKPPTPTSEVRATLEAAHFALSVVEITREERTFSDEHPLVLFALEGALRVRDADGEHTLARGACCIVPPSTIARVTAEGATGAVVVLAPR